jgi:DNA-binding transcriptional LysR family regulator
MNEWIEMFASVVEHSSINRASQALNISQPALSRKLKKLEQTLGVQLFVRLGKRLELTAAGKMTYQYALQLRELHKRYIRELMQYQSTTRKAVTISASLTTLQSSLPDLISLFIQHDPALDIQTITGKTHEVVTFVREQRAHLGLVASRIEEPGMACVPLFDDHLMLVVPSDHPLTRETPLTVAALHGVPMILFSKGTWYRILVDELFTKYRIVPEIKMEIDSFEAIIRLTSTCNAVTLLPNSYLRPQLLRDNGLTALNVRELEQTIRTTSLIYRLNGDIVPWIEARLDNVIDFFSKRREEYGREQYFDRRHDGWGDRTNGE